MHSAPAVGSFVVRSRMHLRTVIVGSLLAWGAVAALLIQTPFGGPSILMVAAWALATWVALDGWRKSPCGLLQWDGQHWSWTCADLTVVCRVGLLFDFQMLILVRVWPENGKHFFLWLEAADRTPKWTGLRRALVAGQRVPQPVATDHPLGHGERP